MLEQTLLILKTQSFPFPVAVSCRKQDGGQADIEACLKFASSMPPLIQPCQLPCQEDCQLSSWSKFSSCTADCVGVRTRKRMLVGKLQTVTSGRFPGYSNLYSKVSGCEKQIFNLNFFYV